MGKALSNTLAAIGVVTLLLATPDRSAHSAPKPLAPAESSATAAHGDQVPEAPLPKSDKLLHWDTRQGVRVRK